MPLDQWAEQNILLPEDSQVTGPFRCTYFPHSRYIFRKLQDERNVRQLCLMCSAQAVIKTTIATVFVLWGVKERPANTAWVLQTEEAVKHFVKSRFIPLIERQTSLEEYLPSTRNDVTELFVKFKTMAVTFRGTNSRGGLKSNAFQRVIFDEADEASPGSLEKIWKRMTSFANPQLLMLGTPENEGGITFREYLAGTQTHFHFACQKCGQRQPIRWGRNSTPVFPMTRECGGFVWDTDETTRPGGRWNWNALAKTVRYQCENPACKHEFRQTELMGLLKDLTPFDNNQLPEKGKVSVWYFVGYSVLFPWELLVQEWLSAQAALTKADEEPLKSFVRERLGEPWVENLVESTEDELRRLCGEFNMGEMWPVEKDLRQAITMTIDVQANRLRWLIVQHRHGGAMRVVDCGWCADEKEALKIQTRYGVGGNGVWIDAGDGNRSAEIYEWCAANRWKACKGSAMGSWPHLNHKTGLTVLKHWRMKMISVAEGASKSGELPFFNWSNPYFKAHVYKFRMKGKGPTLELPRNIPQDAVEELLNDRYQKHKKTGKMEWISSGNEHLGDCLCMAHAQADFFGFTGLSASVPTETEVEKE